MTNKKQKTKLTLTAEERDWLKSGVPGEPQTVSRQRRYQLIALRQGLCQYCFLPRESEKTACEVCRKKRNESQNKRYQAQKVKAAEEAERAEKSRKKADRAAKKAAKLNAVKSEK